jgi:hypothetical protein
LGDYCYNNGLVNETLVKDFSNERRDTVLNFPEDFRKKLRNYHENWPVLIYPWDIKIRLKSILMKNPIVWKSLRKIKRKIYTSIQAVYKDRNYALSSE